MKQNLESVNSELFFRYGDMQAKFRELAEYLRKEPSSMKFDEFDDFCIRSREYEKSITSLFNDTASYLFDLVEGNSP